MSRAALTGQGARELAAELTAAGVRTDSDLRDNYTPGWKYNYWELKARQGVHLEASLLTQTYGLPTCSTARHAWTCHCQCTRFLEVLVLGSESRCGLASSNDDAYVASWKPDPLLSDP